VSELRARPVSIRYGTVQRTRAVSSGQPGSREQGAGSGRHTQWSWSWSWSSSSRHTQQCGSEPLRFHLLGRRQSTQMSSPSQRLFFRHYTPGYCFGVRARLPNSAVSYSMENDACTVVMDTLINCESYTDIMDTTRSKKYVCLSLYMLVITVLVVTTRWESILSAAVFLPAPLQRVTSEPSISSCYWLLSCW
jgi:hypothetical protein